jgi:PAS domain S-box-containing protein
MQHTAFSFDEFFAHSKYVFGSFDRTFNLLEGSVHWLQQLGIDSKELPLSLSSIMLEADFASLQEFCRNAEVNGNPEDELVRLFSKKQELLVYQGQLRLIEGIYYFMLCDITKEYHRRRMFKLLNEQERIASFTYNIQRNTGHWTKALASAYPQEALHAIDPESFVKRIHPDDVDAYHSFHKQLLQAHQPYTVKLRFYTRSGALNYLKLYAEPHLMGGEVVLVSGYAQDITEQEEAIHTIKRDKELIDLAIKGIKSGVFQHDLITDQMQYGPDFREKMGLDEVLSEQDFRKHIHPDDRTEAYTRHLEALKQPGNYYFNHYRLKCKTGDYRHYEVHAWRMKDASGIPIRMVGNLIDVEDKHAYQEQLQRTNAQLQAVVNNGFVSMVLLDAEGRILLLDEASDQGILREMGVSSKETAVYFKDMLPPFEQGVFLEEFKKALAGRSIRKEVSHTLNDGKEQWYDFMYTPLPNEEGQITSVLLKYLDITRLKQSQMTERSLRERAEELNTMKSNFLANMSHEIRTPLNGILSTVELLPTAESKEELEQLIKIQKESGERLLETLTGIINLSLLEAERRSLHITDESLLELTKAAFESYAHHARKKKLKYTFQVEVLEDVRIRADKEMLLAALKNVVHNAVKFTDEGAVEIRLYVDRAKQIASVWVKDTGIGIEPSKMDAIFTTFTQVSEGVSRNFEGSGIGLSLSRKYLQLIGGSITVKSKEHQGSEFVITLPYTA